MNVLLSLLQQASTGSFSHQSEKWYSSTTGQRQSRQDRPKWESRAQLRVQQHLYKGIVTRGQEKDVCVSGRELPQL